MTTSPTLVLPPRYTDDSIVIGKAAHSVEWEIERLSGWRAPDWLRERKTVLYGEPLFAAVVADSLDIVLYEPPFAWLSRLPDELLLRKVRYMQLSEARTLSRSFIKPADDKCFEARVYESGLELPAVGVLPDNIPTLVSEPVSWLVEFRCFVANRQLMAISPYLRNGELAQNDCGEWFAEVVEYRAAEQLLSRLLADKSVELPPGVVIDVGLIEGRGWAVVEANPAWGSGIYGCDPVGVLKTIELTTQRRGEVPGDLQQWVVQRTC